MAEPKREAQDGTPTERAGPSRGVVLFERISKREVATVARELSVLVDVGQPLLKALKILAGRQTNGKMAQLLSEAASDIEQGSTLSSSLAKHPNLFSELVLSIIRVGEVSGSLDLSLRRLSDLLERDLRNRNRLMAALIYPALAIVVMIVVICLVSTLVLPVFKEAFSGQNVKWPWQTLLVFGFGEFLRSWWLLVLVVVIAACFAIWFFKNRTTGGKRFFDVWFIRGPLFGALGKKVMTVRIAETFSILLKSGIPILNGLKIVGQTSENSVVADVFKRAAEDVEKGGNLATVLQESKIFPPLVIDMISIGDEAGALDVVLDKVAETYNDQINIFLETFTSLVEPVLIVILGGVVLLLALAIYLPIWETSQQALNF